VESDAERDGAGAAARQLAAAAADGGGARWRSPGRRQPISVRGAERRGGGAAPVAILVRQRRALLRQQYSTPHQHRSPQHVLLLVLDRSTSHAAEASSPSPSSAPSAMAVTARQWAQTPVVKLEGTGCRSEFSPSFLSPLFLLPIPAIFLSTLPFLVPFISNYEACGSKRCAVSFQNGCSCARYLGRQCVPGYS